MVRTTGRARASARRAGRPVRLDRAVAMAAVALMALLAEARPARAASPDRFACNSAAGIWQPLDSSNHDNLHLSLLAPGPVAPGTTVRTTAVWEWREWRPGAALTLRVCADVDATADGEADAPFDSMGAGRPDERVTEPATKPSTIVAGPRGKGPRAAVEVPVSIVVPANAPDGGEVCLRAAVFGDPADHLHSPPLFDVSPTVCVPIAAPPGPPPPAPTPPGPPPPAPTSTATPSPAPARVAPTVLAHRILPVTGSPAGLPVVVGLALVVLGTLLVRRGRPSGRREPTS